MSKKRKPRREEIKHKILAWMFIIIAILISLHQFLYYGSWFEIKDIHHEVLITAFAFAGIVLLYVYYWNKRNYPLR